MKERLRLGLLIILVILGTQSSFSQNQQVTGTVSDINQVPIPGVNITVKGTSRGTTTDFDGHYEIQASQGETLVFSYVGYRSIELEVNDDTLNATLEESTDALDEVVVTALGISREKKSLGYSVQEVSADDLTREPQTNLVNALAGKVAGAQIASQGGAPGQGASIVIRGINSIDPSGDNEPLFVVDGVPISNDTYTVGGGSLRGMTNRSSDINMEDIESLSVLKGGAATALYGVRAANGAIIITTKKGKAGKTTFNIMASTSYDEVDKFPKTQDKYTQGWHGEYEDGFWPSWGPTIEEAKKVNPDHPDKIFNNYRNLYKSGVTNKLNFSASGGNEKSTFYASYNRHDQEGIIPFTNYVKNGAKIAGDIQVFEKFKVFGSLDYINSGGHKADANALNESMAYWAPNHDVNDYEFKDGPLEGTQKGYYDDQHSGDNAVYSAKYDKLVDDVDRFFGNLGFNYNPIEGLNINYRFGLDYYSDNRKHTIPGIKGVELENVYDSGNKGYISETRILSKDLTSNIMASYERELSDKFDLTLRAGFDVFQREYDRLTTTGKEFDIYDFYHLSNAAVIETSQLYTQTRTVGLYGEIGFSYDDFLFLTITDRNDWASTLPKKNRSFNYPSVSLGYLFTENLNNKPDWLDYGKLRGSWAQIGKDAVGAYLTSDVYSATAPNFPVDDVTGWTRPGNKADPDLRSELTKEIEFGTELKLFDNRLGLDVAWYKSNATQQILSVPISATAGYNTFTTNAGEIQNSGFEVILNGTPIRTQDFSWDINVNFSNNKNKVVAIREGIENVFVSSDFGYVGSSASQRLFVGQPYGTILGTSYERYYENPANEDPLYVDKDQPLLIGENGFPVLNTEQKIIGDSTPDWIMNIGNTLRYKGFSLSFNFDFRQGFQKFNNLGNFFSAFGTAPYTLDREDMKVFDGYLADGTKNTKEVYLGQGVGPDGENYGDGYYRNHHRTATENFVEDASWVRLKEMSLTYQLPKDFIEKIALSNASITASGYNLWIDTKFSGFDPQGSISTAANSDGFNGLAAFPGLRSYALTLRLTF